MVATPRVVIDPNLIKPPRVVTAVNDKPLTASIPQSAQLMRMWHKQACTEVAGHHAKATSKHHLHMQPSTDSCHGPPTCNVHYGTRNGKCDF
jgi:hypothetical protein